MKFGKWNFWMSEIVAALFVCLFLYTGISKLKELHSFHMVLSQSPLIGSLSGLLIWILPITELVLAGLLFMPGTRRLGLALSLILMMIFTGYVIYMLLFVPHLPCSCGGVIRKLNWKEHLILNILLTILAFLGLHVAKPNKEFIAISRKSRTPV